jgi:glycosyltransferase involved in cell wall biosynthesis
MAAYNGASYIRQQLNSILGQLSYDDEVIIIDDASSDETLDQIILFHDNRIRVVSNTTNQGVVASFEKAISMASGQILFLSDQDDIWRVDKVDVILAAFAKDPSLTLIATDASIIDARGDDIGCSYYATRGAFSFGIISNLIKNKYLGCTMAFRAEILQHVLPFPKDYDVFHDIWIGMRNHITGGRGLYINAPLVAYRRHSHNVSQTMKRMRQLYVRWHLILALGRRFIKDHFG